MNRKQAVNYAIQVVSSYLNGGKGSGNFGHGGRPGKVGGSSSTGGSARQSEVAKAPRTSVVTVVRDGDRSAYIPVFDEKGLQRGEKDYNILASDNGYNVTGFSEKEHEEVINDKAVKSLNDEQQSALTDYTGSIGGNNYSKVNEYARTGKGTEQVAKAYETVVSAIDKPLGGNIELFRGVSEDIFTDKKIQQAVKQVYNGNFTNIDSLTEKLSSFTYEDKAPISTTTGGSTKRVHSASGYAQRKVGLYILADKNTKGMYINPISEFGGKGVDGSKLAGAGIAISEDEVLLHPSNKFKVGAIAFQQAGTMGSVGSRKTRLRTDLYLIPQNHKYVKVKKGSNGLRTYTYQRPDGSTYTIQVA